MTMALVPSMRFLLKLKSMQVMMALVLSVRPLLLRSQVPQRRLMPRMILVPLMRPLLLLKLKVMLRMISVPSMHHQLKLRNRALQ